VRFCLGKDCSNYSPIRVVFYLNRSQNIARLATRNFDEMTKDDVQELVLKVRELRKKDRQPAEGTVLDHLTAIKTFWKWLRSAEDEFPHEVKWIKTRRAGSNSQLRFKRSTAFKFKVTLVVSI
jgi:hypothetical protein